MVFKGFKFGILLQLAVGPVCLFILKTASVSGFLPAMAGVAGVCLVDGLYIAAAILGLGALISKKPTVKKVMSIMGGVVLILFGLSNLLGAFGISLLPSLKLSGGSGIFVSVILLTLSNPLTILFWAGVFASRITQDNLSKEDMWRFGLGALVTTPVFLTFSAAVGTGIGLFLPETIILILNALVGCALIYFGTRTLFKKI